MSSPEVKLGALERLREKSHERNRLIFAVILLLGSFLALTIYMENRFEAVSGEVLSKDSRVESSIALVGRSAIPTTVTRYYLTVSYPSTGSDSNVIEEIRVRDHEFQSCEPAMDFTRERSGAVSCGEPKQ